MGHKQLKLSTLLLLGIGLAGLQAQENINATGANASGSGGSVSYSIGQVFYNTNTGTNTSMSQGVQQPYEISVTTNIGKLKGITLSAYPNPTYNYLILEIKEFEFSNLNFHLYDMNGKLLQIHKIIDNQTSIIMKTLVPATYFLKVMQFDKEIKTFKIIKK